MARHARPRPRHRPGRPQARRRFSPSRACRLRSTPGRLRPLALAFLVVRAVPRSPRPRQPCGGLFRRESTVDACQSTGSLPSVWVRDRIGNGTSQVEQLDIAAVLEGARPRRRRIGQIAVWAAVAVVAAGGLWYWWAASGAGSAVTYTTQAARLGDLTVTVTATGTVEPTNEVELSSELSGMIGSVEVDFNDRVTEGQALARLKTDQLQANVDLATATLAARKAELDQAEATVSEKEHIYERAKQLLEKAFSSTETFETAEANHARAIAARAAAAANLDIASANLKIARSNLEKADITSPINGVVLDRDVEVGQIVASSLSAPVLFTLAEDLTKMQLQVDVDEADMGLVTEGDQATFTVEAFSDREFPAAIAQLRLSPETVEGVVTYKAI
ncbi:MAG: efflux RND transporter periplasmic adaptor subunit, partial [Bauldia sp.]